ncbi:glycosyl transferase family 1 [Dictyobacter vulcani]|uniref:Glycosyl transferase family 1 n=1 Tax=Dictyobacter vulcani TaxID=2607529 RepID=A0A5J4KSX8_9CHLR|nr:glycosyltransferase family 4 protein [Dictyobacter vulcani]GER89560.1 glycosyl transferase family 1 [Dictyobacter vulcani]
MRILFITPYVPSPIRVRSFHILKALSHEHEISLVSPLIEQDQLELVKEIENYCTSIDLVTVSKRLAYTNCLRALLSSLSRKSLPLELAYYQSDTFIHCLKEVVRRQKIDVIHGELLNIVPALNTLHKDIALPIVYDAVDCASWSLQQKLEKTRHPLKKLYIYSELQKTRRVERDELQNFDQLLIGSATDRDRLGQIVAHSAAMAVVGNQVDTDYFTRRLPHSTTNSLVFYADLEAEAATQALLHFCHLILPLVWQEKPEVTLTIVGSKPSTTVQALTADPRITLTDAGSDVRPQLEKATVALAPFLVAADNKFKILEALAMSTPVVTTIRCSQALQTIPGQHLLAAEAAEAQAYAEAILSLLNNPALARKLGQQGRQFVLEHASWNSASTRLNHIYHTLPGIAHCQESKTFLSFLQSPHTEQIRKV